MAVAQRQQSEQNQQKQTKTQVKLNHRIPKHFRKKNTSLLDFYVMTRVTARPRRMLQL
jgi:hypothetical protein